jgi:quinol-cytochrome oxidoreductase complex cytochrome b subunit
VKAVAEKKKKKNKKELRSRPFWPGFALEELSVLLLAMGIILIFASLLHPSQVFESTLEEAELMKLESPADPLNTPPRILPEWYFLAVFEFLKLMPPWVVTALIGLFGLAFIITPFIERFLSRFKYGDWALRLSVIVIVVIFLYFTAKGMGLTE